jgi:hypothetical protein
MQGRQQGPKAPLPQANSVQNSWKQSSNCLHELPEMHSRVHTNSHEPSTSHACMHTRNAGRQLKCLLIVCRAPKDQLSAGDGDAPRGDMHTANTLSRSEPCWAAAGEDALHTALHCRSRLLTVVNTAQHSTTPQERQISRTARNTTILLHTPAHTSFTAFTNPPIQFWRDKPQAEQGRASRQQPCTTHASMQDHEYRLLGRKAIKEWTALHTHHLPCHTTNPNNVEACAVPLAGQTPHYPKTSHIFERFAPFRPAKSGQQQQATQPACKASRTAPVSVLVLSLSAAAKHRCGSGRSCSAVRPAGLALMLLGLGT